MKRILRPLFDRVARSLGILELQELAANQERFRSEVAEAIADQASVRKEVAEVERLIFWQVSERLEILRNEMHDLLISHTERFTTERLDAAQSAVIAHSTAHTEHLNNELRSYLNQLVAEMRREIDLVRAGSRNVTSVRPITGGPSTLAGESRVDDAMYVAIEDHFRGSQELVRQRQEAYLPHVFDSVSIDFPLIDFGCGRGEWLEVLRDQGLPARGYDSNVVCVDECSRKGLQVEHGNLVDVLNSLPDESVGAVTFFQVFEHLPFSVLEDVMRSCRRVLKAGGVLIAEVPNSENLSVGSSTFWIDPTHERPLHPEVLRFLARKIGFSDVSGVYSTPLREQVQIAGNGPIDTAVRDIFHSLFGPADFALVARV